MFKIYATIAVFRMLDNHVGVVEAPTVPLVLCPLDPGSPFAPKSGLCWFSSSRKPVALCKAYVHTSGYFVQFGSAALRQDSLCRERRKRVDRSLEAETADLSVEVLKHGSKAPVWTWLSLSTASGSESWMPQGISWAES